MSQQNKDLRDIHVRAARQSDIAALQHLHRLSMLILARSHYTYRQVDGLFSTIDTADPALIDAGTYMVAERGNKLVASAAWTMDLPPWERDSHRLGSTAVATIRAVFTHPDFGRQGLARRLMSGVEVDAVNVGGADHIELASTVSAITFYERIGYTRGAVKLVPLSNGLLFPVVKMTKEVSDRVERGEAA